MTTESLMAEMQAVIDRDQIRDCLARVARGEDRRCDARLRRCYWPDAKTDFGIFQGNLEQYLNWVVPGAEAVLLTQHILGQSVIHLEQSFAAVETHVTSYHRVNTGSDQRDMVIGGRYLDKFEKRSGEWRILERTMVYDWAQDWGGSADWSQGLMGAPFNGDHYTGRTLDDFSEQFFQKVMDEE